MLIVQKYGGSSVGDLPRIRACAARSLALQAEGNDVIVVVSAMAGETNRLIALANELLTSAGGDLTSADSSSPPPGSPGGFT